MNRILLFSIISVCILSSCEKIIYINLDEGEQKIVLNGALSPDSSVVVHVTRTRQISQAGPDYWEQPEPDSMIVDDVVLYEDGRLIGHLEHLRDYFFGVPDFWPSAGKTYRLEASSGKMKPATATVTIPVSIPINSFDTVRFLRDNWQPAVRISMQFTDPGVEENYYALEIVGIQHYYDWRNNVFTDSIIAFHFAPTGLVGRVNDVLDLDFLDINQEFRIERKLLFSDQLFNGKVFDLSFDILKDYSYRMEDTVRFKVGLLKVEKPAFLFAVSMQKYGQAQGNPFAEPVQLYTNVENGFGLVSASNGEWHEFTMVWKDR